MAWEQPRVDPDWWTTGSLDGRPMLDVLRERDIATVFQFLGSRGWSRAAIAAATGLTETRVRGIVQGKQRIASYEVLERIADGLQVDRGLLGLAYTNENSIDRPLGRQSMNDATAREGTPSNSDLPRRSATTAFTLATTEDAAERLRSAPGAPSGPAQNLFQLPPDIADFTGRKDTVEALIQFLTEQSSGHAVDLAVLTGKGGIGKTALGVHVAHHVRPAFPDGQLYVDLRGHQQEAMDPSQVLGRFLSELGLESASIPDRLEDRARLFRSQLAGRRVLVVLDNAIDERQVRPLLPGTAGCAVLVTSRRRLMGLAGARHIPLEIMPVEQGLELLRSIVTAIRVEAELGAARDIVLLCGRLPLALRIAGARLASRPDEPLAAYVQRLRDERNRLDLLKAGDLEVRTTFALSYDECDPDSQRSFRLLGILETPTFAPWALALLEDRDITQAEEALERLVDAELLEVSASDATGSRRYRFHDLLRVYARECLVKVEQHEERREAVTRLLSEYLRLGINAVALAEPAGLEQPVSALEPALTALEADPRGWSQSERAAFVTGAGLAFEFELWDLAWRLAELVPMLLRWQSDWADWSHTLTLGLEAARRCASLEGQARIRCSLGLLHRAQGNFGEAITELNESAKIFISIGDELRAAVAQRQLGDTYRYTGLLQDGLSVFSESLKVFQREDCRRMTAGALNGLGDIYRGLSRWDESVASFDQAITVYESLGDTLEVARARVRFGIVYRDRCLYSEAEELFMCGLDALRDLKDRRWEARAIRHLGIVYRNTGEISQAMARFTTCLEIFADLADRRGIAVARRNVGDAYRLAGEIDQSEAALRDALIRFQDLGDERWQARTLVSIADTIRHRQSWSEAETCLDAATRIYDLIGDAPGQARVQRSRGILFRAQQRWKSSLLAFERSASLFKGLGDHIWQARAIAGAARTKQACGDDSWLKLQEAALGLCRGAGASSTPQVENWLVEW